MDTANRALTLLVAVAVAVFMAVGMAACVVLGSLAYGVAVEGVSALGSRGDLLPAVGFLGLVAVGALLGFRSLVSQLVATSRLARRIAGASTAPPDWLDNVAQRLGLGGRVRLLEVGEPFSFTYGLVSPVVVVSRGLLERCTPEEVETVLTHERYHVQNLDPLKVVVARTLPASLYLMPVLRTFQRRYLAGRELAADRRAVQRHGPGRLAGVLYKVVRGPAWPELAGAAAIGGEDVLDVRVAQLESGREPALPPPRRLEFWTTGLGLAVLSGAFLLAVRGSEFGGPMPRMMVDQAPMAPFGILGGLLCVGLWIVAGLVVLRLLRSGSGA